MIPSLNFLKALLFLSAGKLHWEVQMEFHTQHVWNQSHYLPLSPHLLPATLLSIALRQKWIPVFPLYLLSSYQWRWHLVVRHARASRSSLSRPSSRLSLPEASAGTQTPMVLGSLPLHSSHSRWCYGCLCMYHLSNYTMSLRNGPCPIILEYPEETSTTR